MKKKPDKNIIKAHEVKPPETKRTAKGPEPERLKIEGDWKAAVRTAMQKPKPAGGWPR
jgi:hypothetical protein